jgi:hypothetical protein
MCPEHTSDLFRPAHYGNATAGSGRSRLALTARTFQQSFVSKVAIGGMSGCILYPMQQEIWASNAVPSTIQVQYSSGTKYRVGIFGMPLRTTSPLTENILQENA